MTTPAGNGSDASTPGISTPRASGQRFALVLRDLGGAGPTINRLRSALKCLLRSYGFKCEKIQEAIPGEDAGGAAGAEGRSTEDPETVPP